MAGLVVSRLNRRTMPGFQRSWLGLTEQISTRSDVFLRVLGDALSKTAVQRGRSVRDVAGMAGIRVWRLRRVFLGRASAGPVELKRLLSVLRLDAGELEEVVYVEAGVQQLAAETEARERDARMREHL